MKIENIEFIAKYKGKTWKIITMDWFVSSGCTKRKPSWLTLEREVKDEDGEFCRAIREEVLTDAVDLYIK